MKSLKSVVLFLLLLSFTPIVYAQTVASASGIYTLPFQTKDEIEVFLRTAKIVKDKELGKGVTIPHKLTLDNGKIQSFAVWKTIDERHFGITQLAGGPEVDFKDSWKFEVAAYELDKLLNLNMVPVTVERSYKGTKGSLQIWVPNCMTEEDRVKKQLHPTDELVWKQETSKMRVFDALIYNSDRNQGNLLIDPTWKLYLIDHSRTFKSLDVLKPTEQLNYFSKSLMDAVRKLDKNQIKQHCGKYLMTNEIDNLLKRRDLLVALYTKLTAQDGDGITYP
jgi:hypothetical protein